MAALCAVYADRMSAVCTGTGADGKCAGSKGTRKRADVSYHGDCEEGIWYRDDPPCYVPRRHGNRMDGIYRHLICGAGQFDRKFLNYNYREQLADLVPSILLASAMGVCVYFTGMIALPTIVTVILQVLVGAVVYILLSILLKFSQFTYILQVLKNFTQSFRKGKKKA